MKNFLVIGIIFLLLQHDRLTLTDLALMSNISESQVSSILDHLCKIGIPLIAMFGGGYTLPEETNINSLLRALMRGYYDQSKQYS